MRKFLCLGLAAALTLTALATDVSAFRGAAVGRAFRAARALRAARLGLNRIGLNRGLVRNRGAFLLNGGRNFRNFGYGGWFGAAGFAAGYAGAAFQEQILIEQPPPVITQQTRIIVQTPPPSVIIQQESLQYQAGGCAGAAGIIGAGPGYGGLGVNALGYGLGGVNRLDRRGVNHFGRGFRRS